MLGRGRSTGSTSRRQLQRRVLRLLALSWVVLSAGCAWVPQTKLEESRRVSQTLRADNDRLKDVALDLRTQNQDLSDRAVDDARRIAVQDEAIERLERSVVSYQSDRDKIEKAFEAIKQQVRVAAGAGSVSEAAATPPPPAPASRFGPLEAFVEGHPEWSFDAAAGTLSVAPDRLFVPSSTALKPDVDETLVALASALGRVKDEGARGKGIVVEVLPSPMPPPSPVIAAGFIDDPAPEAPARFLAAARAAKVRDRLATSLGPDSGQVRLASQDEDAAPPGETAPRLSIRVNEIERPASKPAPALDSGPRHDP